MIRSLSIVLVLLIASVSSMVAQEHEVVTANGSKSFNFTLNGFGDFGPGGSFIGATPLGNSELDSLLNTAAELFGTEFLRPVYGFGMTFFVADNFGLRLGLGANADIAEPTAERYHDVHRCLLGAWIFTGAGDSRH